MENIIFAVLLYILVPALLLWLNYESSIVNLSKANHDIKLANRELNLTSRDEAWRSHHTNPSQKTSENKVQPTIEGEGCVVSRRIPNHLVQKIESEETPLDYHQLTIRQLKKIAQKKKIKRYGNMRKQDLISALTS